MQSKNNNLVFIVKNREERKKVLDYILNVVHKPISSTLPAEDILQRANYFACDHGVWKWGNDVFFFDPYFWDVIDDMQVVDKMIWEDELKKANLAVQKLIDNEPKKSYEVSKEVKHLIEDFDFYLNGLLSKPNAQPSLALILGMIKRKFEKDVLNRIK